MFLSLVNCFLLAVFVDGTVGLFYECGPESKNITVEKGEPVFIQSVNYPLSVGLVDTSCDIRLQTPDDDEDGFVGVVVTHINVDEYMVDDVDLGVRCGEEDGTIFGDSPDRLQYGGIIRCTHQSHNIHISMRYNASNQQAWKGFQAMAFYNDYSTNSTSCALDGGTYRFEDEKLNEIYYIASATLQETYPEQNCSWRFDAVQGYVVKFFIRRFQLQEGETLRIVSHSDNVTYESNDPVEYKVLYLVPPVEVFYDRLATVRNDSNIPVRFDALVSAGPTGSIEPCNWTELSLDDDIDYHFVYNYTPVYDCVPVKVIAVPAGYDLQMVFDAYNNEQCCDLIDVVNIEDDVWARMEPYSIYMYPAGPTAGRFAIQYSSDRSKEMAGFDLKFRRKKCSCPVETVVELKDEEGHRDYEISSFNDTDYSHFEGNYCSNMTCSWTVLIPNNTETRNYSMRFVVNTILRDIDDDYILVESDLGNLVRVNGFAIYKNVYQARSTTFRFNSGFNPVTRWPHSMWSPWVHWLVYMSLESSDTTVTTPEPMTAASEASLLLTSETSTSLEVTEPGSPNFSSISTNQAISLFSSDASMPLESTSLAIPETSMSEGPESPSISTTTPIPTTATHSLSFPSSLTSQPYSLLSSDASTPLRSTSLATSTKLARSASTAAVRSTPATTSNPVTKAGSRSFSSSLIVHLMCALAAIVILCCASLTA